MKKTFIGVDLASLVEKDGYVCTFDNEGEESVVNLQDLVTEIVNDAVADLGISDVINLISELKDKVDELDAIVNVLNVTENAINTDTRLTIDNLEDGSKPSVSVGSIN